MKYYLAVIAIVIAAIVYRSSSLEKRPMHVDEAVHAIKFGRLLEKGDYRYDPVEYHGPTLNYFTLIPAYLTESKTLTQVSEGTLRSVPLFFGLGLLLLLLFLKPVIHSSFVLFALLFTAFSAPMVFYSRYYIQETLLVTFAYGFLICLFRYVKTHRPVWSVSAGIFLGLVHATKETGILFIAAMVFSAIILFLLNRPQIKVRTRDIGILIGSALLISTLFYSSFFSNWRGVYDAYAAYFHYIDRAGDNPLHLHPWYYYVKWLFYFQNNEGPVWSEVPILFLGCLGVYYGRNNKYLRFIAINSTILFIIFTVIPYKTPWNILLCWQGMLLLAGYGGAHLVQNRYGRIVLIVVIVHMLWLSWLTNVVHDADQENPYVYAHTTRDIPEMAQIVLDRIQHNPDGKMIPVQIFASNHDYWPLPWYFRSLKNVGWYNHLDTLLHPAAVIIISPDLEAQLIHFLYQIPPPGERSLYLPVSRNPIWLRHGVELEAYLRSDVYAGF
jgi:uncharacterized protein (TIGR03663 family)